MDKFKKLVYLTRYKDYYGAVLITTAIGIHSVKPVELQYKILITTASLLGAAFVFMFNNIEDADDDFRDTTKKKLNPISNKSINKRSAYAASFLTVFLSLFFYSLVGLGVLTLGLIAMFLGMIYSWRKIRLKAIPFIDLASHGATHSLVYLTPVALYPSRVSMIEIFLLAGAIFVSSVLGDIKNEIRDDKVDREAGLKNTAHYVDLTKIRKYIFHIQIVALLTIILTVSLTTSPLTLILFLLVVVGIAVHYWKTWMSKENLILDYPQKQTSFTILSLILLVA